MRKSLPVTGLVKCFTASCTCVVRNTLLRRFQLLLLVAIGFFISAKSFAQSGVAPVVAPTGGMNIDGFLERQGSAGDWLAATGGSTAGTYLFLSTAPGAPAPPFNVAPYTGKIFHKIDLYNDANDEGFDGGNKLNQNPNVWGW